MIGVVGVGFEVSKIDQGRWVVGIMEIAMQGTKGKSIVCECEI